jgi:hypothetical protein
MRGITPQVFFLEARDDVLIKRSGRTGARSTPRAGVASSIALTRAAGEVRAEPT